MLGNGGHRDIGVFLIVGNRAGNRFTLRGAADDPTNQIVRNVLSRLVALLEFSTDRSDLPLYLMIDHLSFQSELYPVEDKRATIESRVCTRPHD